MMNQFCGRYFLPAESYFRENQLAPPSKAAKEHNVVEIENFGQTDGITDGQTDVEFLQ